MRPVFPALWLSARGIWALFGVALTLALASAVPVLLPLVAVGAVALITLAAVDAALGPGAGALRIIRRALPPLALRRRSHLAYDLENRGALAVRIGIVEPVLAAVAFPASETVVRLPPRSRASAQLDIEPRERGAVRFGPFYAWSENRIGLLRRRYRIEADEEGRIFPDLSAVVGSGRLAERRTLLDAGLRRLRLRGDGTEFESLREYSDGDGFGRIDWKATARRGRTMVAQYEPERSQNVIVALDCGRLMTPRLGTVRKFDYALTAALSVARVAQQADDNVGVTAFAARPLLELAPRRGAAHFRALAQALYDVQPCLEEADYETICAALGRRYTKRSLIVLFTDIFDPVTSRAVLAGVATLVPRHLVVCVLMNDAVLAAALDADVHTPTAAFRTAVAMRLSDERAKAVAALRGRGVIIIDVPAPKLTTALIDTYLDIKARGRL
ncbi:MAG: DUF58 domain-containing protein [Candidatus Eremiobacteraeota bacterium]|nr:DUF58 domain-containing protein [Candidatus Eremiobacteraeota bacterium]MBC5803209.1 DUF58 domain-containing protein [Candidatus Eremiobacteraeota bacterium]MBC5822281.1 DUF58 domain-containing protein [Candidatus Eremiobacteraeota bacterium]